MTTSPKFAVTSHTADIGLDAYGKTLPELFENAATGMFSLLIDPAEVSTALQERVRVEAKDQSALLVAWLNELIFLFQTQHMALCGFHISRFSETGLEAHVEGELIDPHRHHPLREIKSATYHELSVDKTREGYKGHILFDV